MPTIAATIIWKPRRHRYCVGCGDLIQGSQIRAYGNADTGDRPYVIRLCWACGIESSCPKIKKAAEAIATKGELCLF